MKNLLLLLVVLTSPFVSCTSESIDNAKILDDGLIENKSKKTAKLLQNLNPENPANVYDIAGKIHNDILDVYLSGNYSYNTIAQISQKVDSIAALNSDLLNMGTSLPCNFQEIQETVNDPQIKLEQAIANSLMTNAAKISLSNFMDSILLLETNEYAVIHQSIISFEASVISNTQFSNEDKRIILTTSSIVRHSTYYAKERKDKDWETSVGNRVGAVQGALENSSTAVNKSVVTGIIVQSQAE
ncbi:hypothetical protein [Flavobacterium saccharophilum]|uniref:Lipoprotein n=1 Tax=Flavobacterium saccharophilum TaxID=29534 RepID=A0A1M7JFA8_9FLAO|nr:hypothetical protein [Flavobacterium saccharophilum]SHM51665.1 hypothetical protein SAMN05444366_3331 [Flavobacterium saccharophilum]